MVLLHMSWISRNEEDIYMPTLFCTQGMEYYSVPEPPHWASATVRLPPTCTHFRFFAPRDDGPDECPSHRSAGFFNGSAGFFSVLDRDATEVRFRIFLGQNSFVAFLGNW
jgi:hypothetical protein